MSLIRLAVACALLGLLIGLAASPGTDTPGTDRDAEAWRLPERARSPRFDPQAFAKAFERLAWPVSSAAETETPGQLASWRLLGVVSEGGARFALLAGSSGGTVRRERTDARLPGGITVERIDASRVVLRDAAGCRRTIDMPPRADTAAACPPSTP